MGQGVLKNGIIAHEWLLTRVRQSKGMIFVRCLEVRS